MARARDYAAEYAARQARAQASGYSGYWQQRAARELGLETGGKPRAGVTNLSAREMRQGVAALKRRDFDTADRLARRAGGQTRKGRKPRGISDRDWANRRAPRRIFYYH